MDSNYVDNLIDDDEIPELTEEDAASMIPFAQMPADFREHFKDIKNATFRPDPVKKPVSIALSTDIIAKFEKTGEGWESRVDDALREWLDEHSLPFEHAKAS